MAEQAGEEISKGDLDSIAGLIAPFISNFSLAVFRYAFSQELGKEEELRNNINDLLDKLEETMDYAVEYVEKLHRE